MDAAHEFTYAHYARILRAAKDAGYRFGGYDGLAAEGLTCVLRHDCDNDLTAAARMAAVEAEHGAASTYFLMLRSAQYNLLGPTSRELVGSILERGHALGLHFDARPYAAADAETVVAAVDAERSLVAREFGVPIDVVSFHQPSKRILDNEIRISCRNTYDRADMAGYHYLSDSCMVWKEGCPSDFLRERRSPRLQLLIHPEWWTETELSIEQKWTAMLRNNFELMQGSLLAREKSYPRRQEISFR